MMRRMGQSTVEITVLLIVVLGALIFGGVYLKRGIQGRWKAAVDDLGDQYDPAYMDSRVMHVLKANTETTIWAEPAADGGYWTMRKDKTDAIDSQFGNVVVTTDAR